MNGFIKVLEEIGADKQKDLDAAAKLREQLKEALALLEMFKDCCADEPRERVRAFLASRTAPQPEPTQASAAGGAKYFDWDRTPAQPAAPTAECRYSESFCGDTGCPTHGIEQPAAPTAEQAFEDGLDGSDWTKPPQPAAPEPSGALDRLFGALPDLPNPSLYEETLDESRAWQARAESAEARITAVQGQIETAVAQRLEAAVMSALRYEREESHSNTTRRALVIESRMDEALELLESAARIVENDDWRDRYDVLRGFIAADPEPAQKPALRPEFIALGKALCAPLAPVATAPSPGEGEETP